MTVNQPPNQAPSAVDDTASTTRGIAVTVSVLTNDSDPDPGDTIRVSAIAALPANGSAAAADSDTPKITYTPSNHHIGNDTFRYRIADRAGLTAEATVTVTVDTPPAPYPLPSTCADPMDTLVADAGRDQTVSPGTLVTLDGSDSGDGLGCSIRYSWRKVEGPDVTLSSRTARMPTFAVPEDAEDGTAWVLELTVRHRSNSQFFAVDRVRVTVDVDPLTLNDLRDTLVEGWADRIGRGDDVCEAWNTLDASARNVFIWNTHRLHGSDLLREVEALHYVFGTNIIGTCGGEEYNRTYMSMSRSLQDKFLAEWWEAPSDPLSVWRRTNDPNGPHDPYMFSVETHEGGPRGQIHFFHPDWVTVRRSFLKGRCERVSLLDVHREQVCGEDKCTATERWDDPHCPGNLRYSDEIILDPVDPDGPPIKRRGPNGEVILGGSEEGAVIDSGNTSIRVVHMEELRRALTEAYVAAGRGEPSLTDELIVAGVTAVRAEHFIELRSAVTALER